MQTDLKVAEFKGLQTEEFQMLMAAIPFLQKLYDQVGDIVADYQTKSALAQLNVLEIGCGDGALTHNILTKCPKIQLVAIDLDGTALAFAQEYLQDWSETRRYNLIQTEALDYLQAQADNSVDVIASAWCIHNMVNTHRRQLLAQVFRKLRPGGLFVNGDKYAQSAELHQQDLTHEFTAYFDAWVPLGKYEFFKAWMFHMINDESCEKLMRETEAIELMKAIGFVEIENRYRKNMHTILVAYKPA